MAGDILICSLILLHLAMRAAPIKTLFPGGGAAAAVNHMKQRQAREMLKC